MSNKHSTLNDLFTGIADAIRGKSGSTEPIVADDFPDAINALPTGKTSYTINLDWSMDEEMIGEVYYVSNGENAECGAPNLYFPDVIEADSGVVCINCGSDSYVSDGIITIYNGLFNRFLLATQDGCTITFVSGDIQ